MLTEPEAFSGYIAGSPAIGLCANLLKERINKFSVINKIKGKFLFIGYGDKERFKPTIDFIPSYSQLLKNRFKDILKIKIQKLPGRHCPSEFMENGFRFIYNK